MIRIGIVGAGAITEKFHLPALRMIRGVHIAALVDKDIQRAKTLSSNVNIRVTDDYQKIFHDVDMVIIALPNYLHAQVALEFLAHDIHVFCEKPMATNTREVRTMIQTAKTSKAKLGIGMVRRYYKINQLVRGFLDSSSLGSVHTFDYEEGYPFDWPVHSRYLFDKNQSGGGVLMDIGSHVLDLLYTFFGKITIKRYSDDYHGGVETNCVMETIGNHISGRIELSRDRMLRNSFIIGFKEGRIEMPTAKLDSFTLQKNGQREVVSIKDSVQQAVCRELKAFIEAIRHNTQSYITGRDVAPSIALIECCYQYRKPLYEPWYIV